MKTAINKVMWIGRATVFTVGLAMTLALLLGAATVALAAVPGDPFKLGKVNTINRLTTLVGSADNAMLKIDNNSTGANASALDLQVEPGKPPFKVNSTTEVQGLNVDSLDSKNSSDFILDTQADQFLPNDTYVVTRTVTGPGGGNNRVASADCDPGDKMLSGGGTGDTTEDDQLLASVPFGQGWDVLVSDNGSASTLTAHVICADFSPEH